MANKNGLGGGPESAGCRGVPCPGAHHEGRDGGIWWGEPAEVNPTRPLDDGDKGLHSSETVEAPGDPRVYIWNPKDPLQGARPSE